MSLTKVVNGKIVLVNEADEQKIRAQWLAAQAKKEAERGPKRIAKVKAKASRLVEDNISFIDLILIVARLAAGESLTTAQQNKMQAVVELEAETRAAIQAIQADKDAVIDNKFEDKVETKA